MSKYNGRASKRKSIRAASYIIAAFLVMGGFLLQERAVTDSYRRQTEQNYQHAFSELVTASSALGTSLQKSLYLTSPGMLSSACSEVFARAEAAQMALGVLPFSDTELEHTASFLSKTGDYACMLAKKASSGAELSAEERSNLKKLSECASLLSENLTNLYADVQSGVISIERSQDVVAGSDDKLVPAALADSFFSMENEFPELPSLIYDGPFSEHISGREPVFLKNESEIDEEEARAKAARFTNIDAKRFTVEHVREDDIPVYVLSVRLARGDMLVEVSRAGGIVTRVNHTRAVDTANISVEDGVGLASRFLRSHGYSRMEESYYQAEENKVTVNFAAAQDGVICYPDLVKVTVALDSGSIVGFESTGYVMCHAQRSIPEPAVSADEAAKLVSGELEVLSHALAVIPTSGKNEVFCHEFKCEGGDGRHYILYVNAETGAEEKLLILIEDENGTLTL